MRKPFRVSGEMRSKSKLKAALAYARAGMPVLALWGIQDGKCTCGKVNCKHPGKHPISEFFPNAYKSATTKTPLIRKAWRKYRSANVGIVPTEVTVIDVDGPTGEETLEQLGAPDTTKVRTGRGFHLYCKGSFEGRPPKLAGIDIKRNNGYVVAPPSTHVSGTRYEWIETKPLESLPDGFRPKNIVSVDFTSSERVIHEGDRNKRLASVAGTLHNRKLPESTISAMLQALNKEACSPPLDRNEVENIAQSICRYERAGDGLFGNMADVVEEEIAWLYEPYIPRGAGTLVEGDPGVGKSNFTMALAAHVSSGRKLSFSKDRPSGSVLLLSAEDEAARVMKPRLRANGANMDRIRYATKPFVLDEEGIEAVRDEISKHEPKLVIIDPLFSYMGSARDLHRSNEMTAFMWELDQIARDNDCSILGVRHLRKGQSGNALYQGIGSISLIGSVRSAMMMGRDPIDPDRRAIAHHKSNYSELAETILFSLVKEPGHKMAGVQWEGTTPDVSADDLCIGEKRARGRDPDERNKAKDFLMGILKDGPMEKSEIVAIAETKAISEMTLRRARTELGVKTKRKDRKSIWSLNRT